MMLFPSVSAFDSHLDFEVDVCSGCQRFDGVDFVEVRGVVQRRVADVVLQVGVGARIAQQLHALCMTTVCRAVQRREVVVAVLLVQRHVALEQQLFERMMLVL